MKKFYEYGLIVLVCASIILSACYALDLFGGRNVLQVDDKEYEAGGFNFSGELADGRFSGYGVIDLLNGERYRGGFSDGRFDGEGVFDHTSHNWRFAGVYTEGQADGGTFYLADDTIVFNENVFTGSIWSYSGALSEQGQSGVGTFVFADGSVYSGSFLSGLANGEGAYTTAGGDTVYAGSFKDGLFDGSGLYVSPEGWSYEGGFKEGLFDGEGVLTTGGEAIRGVWEKGSQVTRYE